MVVTVFQIVLSILLILVILLQQQGTGISPAFGGSGESYRSRRSFEKVLLYATIALAAFFAITSIILLIPH